MALCGCVCRQENQSIDHKTVLGGGDEFASLKGPHEATSCDLKLAKCGTAFWVLLLLVTPSGASPSNGHSSKPFIYILMFFFR